MLVAEVRGDGGKSGAFLPGLAVRRRGRGAGADDGMPGAVPFKKADVRQVGRGRPGHGHIPVSRRGLDLEDGFVVAFRGAGAEEKLRQPAEHGVGGVAAPIEVPIAVEPARIARGEEEEVLLIRRRQFAEIFVGRTFRGLGGFGGDVVFVGVAFRSVAGHGFL